MLFLSMMGLENEEKNILINIFPHGHVSPWTCFEEIYRGLTFEYSEAGVLQIYRLRLKI